MTDTDPKLIPPTRLLAYVHGLKRRLEELEAKPFHLTRRGLWTVVFLALTLGAIGMELYGALVHRSPDTPTWTDLISRYVPPGLTFALIAALVSWIGPHFVAAYRRRRQP